eukprot:gene370-11747_t
MMDYVSRGPRNVLRANESKFQFQRERVDDKEALLRILRASRKHDIWHSTFSIFQSALEDGVRADTDLFNELLSVALHLKNW